jgi:nicotinamidase-related amidase
MEFPDFYNPARVGTMYLPDVAGAINAGRSAGLAPAERDSERIALILVDAQIDFIHTDGTLSVPGAVEDTRRTIEWLLKHTGKISRIVASLDTHVPLQIFYPMWWINTAGEHPPAFTTISAAEVDQGLWRPTVEAGWSLKYVQKLETQAKKTLMIWPYHTMMGSPGHAITPALYEAIVYHSAARSATPTLLAKGFIPKTEHYSILEPEVKVPDEAQGVLNTALLEDIASYDLVYIAGQAKSHCVLETIASLHRYFSEKAPEKIKQWRILMDCTSSVQHPDIDFEAIAMAALARFEAQGLKMVKSTDAIG